jgi:hypothetical protein
MRRLVFPAILASGLVMVGAVPASAEPAPTATTAKAAAGKKVCKITDSVLPELSGIVTTKNGFAVVNDSTNELSQRKIFFLNDDCEITKRVEFPARPLDPEDLVLSADGKTLWIADIGDNAVRSDNGNTRPTIALWSMPADGSKKPKIHRLAYPNGDKHDAEALLLNGDGTPIIVTKEVGGPAGIYVPTAPLKTNNETGVPLKKAGQIELPRTDTAGSAFARLAQGIVTGGAVAPDGSKVVLRTYLDAFEWDVSNGDVLAALKNKPRGTGLPTDPRGEAITYSRDGKLFYTVSDMGDLQDEDTANYILKYTPATKVVTASAGGTDAQAKADDGASWYANLDLTDITYMVAGVGVLGAILVGAGIFGIMRSRKRRSLLEPALKSEEPTGGPKPLDAETELLAVGGPPVYGGNRPVSGAASGPGVYGAQSGPAAAPKGSGVYGGVDRPGGRPAGGQPGRPGGGQAARPAGQPGGSAGRPAGQPGRPAGGQPGRPAGGQPGRPAGGQPARPAGGQPGRPAGGQPGRPAGDQPGRPAGGQPARPAGGQPGRPAGGQPGRPAGGQPGRPAGGQPGRPAGGQPARPAGQPGRPAGGQPGRPAGGQPARPAGGQPGRPAGGQPGAAQPGRSGGSQPPARPGQGGQPAGRPQGGQSSGRPGQGGGQPGARSGGGQPAARPAQGGGQGRSGGRPGSGVYGAPPPPPPTARPSGGSQRSSGFFGQGGDQQGGVPQSGARQSMNHMNSNGSSRGGEGRFDSPGYGRGPRGR